MYSEKVSGWQLDISKPTDADELRNLFEGMTPEAQFDRGIAEFHGLADAILDEKIKIKEGKEIKEGETLKKTA